MWKKRPNLFISVTWNKDFLLNILIQKKKWKMHINSSARSLRKQEAAFISDVLYGYSSSGKFPSESKLNKLGNSAHTFFHVTQQAVLPFNALLFKELSKRERKCKDSWNIWAVIVFLMSHWIKMTYLGVRKFMSDHCVHTTFYFMYLYLQGVKLEIRSHRKYVWT